MSGSDRAPRVIRAGQRLSASALTELWAYRELLVMLAWRDVSVRYRQAVLGVLWALLQPALQVVVFTVLFHRIAGLQADRGVPFAPFVLAGLTLWNVFQQSLTQASDSLVRESHLLSKVYFPRLLVPLAALLIPLVDFVLALGLLLGLMLWLGLPLGPRALLALPLGVGAALAALGPGLVLAVLNITYRDVRHALPFGTQLLLYAAPVFYPASAVPAPWRPWLDLNPVVPLIEALRAALFGGPLPWGRLGLAALETVALGGLGLLCFGRAERTVVDRL